MWCACWDIIPHGANLSKKGIKEFLCCPRCGKEESLFHLLQDCSWVHDVWRVADISSPSISFGSFRDVLGWFWASIGEEVEQFVVICGMCGKLEMK